MSLLLLTRLVFFRQPGDVLVAFAVIGLDLAVEWPLSGAAAFAYSHARFGSLPLWLAPMWGGIGLAIRRFFSLAASEEAAGWVPSKSKG
jgi:hypothetical protein